MAASQGFQIARVANFLTSESFYSSVTVGRESNVHSACCMLLRMLSEKRRNLIVCRYQWKRNILWDKKPARQLSYARLESTWRNCSYHLQKQRVASRTRNSDNKTARSTLAVKYKRQLPELSWQIKAATHESPHLFQKTMENFCSLNWQLWRPTHWNMTSLTFVSMFK